MAAEPRTEAGQRLLEFMDETWRLPYVPENPTVQEMVAAIEAEAVRSFAERVQRAKDEVRTLTLGGPLVEGLHPVVEVSVVNRILDALLAETPDDR